MEVIVFLQSLEPRAWYRLGFSVISWCGDGPVYFLVFPILYWLMSPAIAIRYGYVWGWSALVMLTLKQWAGASRPFLVLPDQVAFWQPQLAGFYWYPSLEVLLEAYRHSPSFPSGHALFAVALGGYLWRYTSSTVWRVALVIWMVLTPLSRLYLGVHYPVDVVAGSMVGLALIFLTARIDFLGCYALIQGWGLRRWHACILLAVLMGIALAFISKTAVFVWLVLLTYPVLLHLTRKSRQRYAAHEGARWRSYNAIVSCFGVGLMIFLAAPFRSLGTLLSVPFMTAWTTLGAPLLVAITTRRIGADAQR